MSDHATTTVHVTPPRSVETPVGLVFAAILAGGLAGFTDWLAMFAAGDSNDRLATLGVLVLIVSHLVLLFLLVATPLRRRGWKIALPLAMGAGVAAAIPAFVIALFDVCPWLYHGHWNFG